MSRISLGWIALGTIDGPVAVVLSAIQKGAHLPAATEGGVMKRVLPACAGVATVAMLLLASIALGSTGGKQAATAKSRIAITNRVSAKQRADNTFGGPFVLALNGVNQDTGTTSIGPIHEPERTVDGQQQARVTGTTTLTGKKGILSLSFRGVSVNVRNFDSTKFPSYMEYGTWKIAGGSGIYKGWKGGGRYAVASNNVEWDGYVTN